MPGTFEEQKESGVAGINEEEKKVGEEITEETGGQIMQAMTTIAKDMGCYGITWGAHLSESVGWMWHALRFKGSLWHC